MISSKNLSFLEKVEIEKLTPLQFQMFKQLVCLAKLYSDSQQGKEMELTGVDFDAIYSKFEDLEQSAREYLITADPALKSSQKVIADIVTCLELIPEIKEGNEITQNTTDDLMTLMEISLTPKSHQDVHDDEELPIVGVQIINDACYVPNLGDMNEPLIRRTVELKEQILEDLFGWEILKVDQSHFEKLDG